MPKKDQSVSQQQIARALGVSQALVSLVLNGRRENISQESYERIWKYAVKMGYRPKGMQTSAGPNTSTNVGFILRAGLRLHTQSNFFSHVQHGLHAGLLARGYHSVFLGSEDDLDVRSVEQKLRHRSLAGLALFGQVEEEFISRIKKIQRNVVAISMSYPGRCHSVMPNEKQAVEQLLDHLASLGHQRYAWIGGDKQLDYNQRRYAAVTERLAGQKLNLMRQFSVNLENGDRLAGWKAGEAFLQQGSRRPFPTACICANGMVARGFVNCLMQRGWKIPEQISVVAIDATRICTEEHPQITGAHADPEQIGLVAAELLLRSAQANDQVLSDMTLPSYLSVRETSGKPAV